MHYAIVKHFTLNLKIYGGKEKNIPHKVSNKTVVKNLITPKEKSNRNIIPQQ